MEQAPDITELLESIREMRAALGVAALYCEHPDVCAMPFAQPSQVAADRAREAMTRASQLLQRAGDG